MTNRHVSASAQRRSRSSTSCGIKKQTTHTREAEDLEVRRSPRLSATSRLESASKKQEAASCFPSQSTTSNTSLKPPSKRKRGQEALNPYSSAQDLPPAKRPRNSDQSAPESQPEEAEEKFVTSAAGPLSTWLRDKQWPREYFEPDDQMRQELLERDSWLEEMMALPPIPIVQYVERNGFRYPLPVRKIPSLRRKGSDSSLSESSNQTRRESKSTPYKDPRYRTMLETNGSFMRDFDHNVPQAITDICHQLLARDQIVPQDSLFRDDLFGRLCWKIQDRNEAMVIQDVTRLIVPSAMNLAICGDTHLDGLIESANEAWTGCIPVEGPRPQPDYAVGFRRSAFTDTQLRKLSPLIGSVFDTSFFVANFRMYFPFFTCEVKCGISALDIADRQNAHSMTIAVRSVVELYRAVKREKELDREILAFSVSHDHQSVRIYGHYPVIDGDKVTFYRHLIHGFIFTALEGKARWTAYKFTRNVYDVWMLTHLERICSAIDQLPLGLDFEVHEVPEVQSEEATSLSQDMDSLLSEASTLGSCFADRRGR